MEKNCNLFQVFSEKFPLVVHQRDTHRLATLLWELRLQLLREVASNRNYVTSSK